MSTGLRVLGTADRQFPHQSLFEEFPDAILLMERSAARVVALNAAAEVLLRSERSQLLGLTLEELSPADRQPDLRAALESLEQSRHWRGPWELLRPDGCRVRVEASFSRTDFEGDSFIQVAFRASRIEDRRRRGEQILAIREVAAELTREVDLARLLDLIIERVVGLLWPTSGILRIWDESTQRLHPLAIRRLRPHTDLPLLGLGEGASGIAAQEQRVVAVENYATWEHAVPGARERSGVAAAVAAPMIYQSRLIGVITLVRTDGDPRFDQRERDILSLFADQAAIAIEKARLFEQERSRRLQIEAIREVTAEIARELDLDRLLELTFQRANELVRGSMGWIFLWDEAAKLLVPRATSIEAARERRRRIRLGQGVTGMAAQGRGGLIVNDYAGWPTALRDAEGQVSFAAVMASPILYQDRLIGVITIARFDPGDQFTNDELSTLTTFASHAAIAIEHARLYEERSRHADQMQELVSKVYRAQDEERRRLAYEVHDGLAQTAAATHQHLEALATVVRPRTQAGRRELAQARALAQRLVGEARCLIAGLRPTVLDDLGLASAVGVELGALRDSGCTVHYRENLGSRRLPPPVETALFSVAREALTNVRKHAEAKHVGIALTLSDDAVSLEIRDAGIGFDLAAIERCGNAGERIGLQGMRERVAWLGGTLDIQTRRGRGTSVTAVVPIASDGLDR